MRYLLLILLLFSVSVQLNAQSRVPTGPVYFEIDNDNDDLKGMFEWAGGGIILVTGQNSFINEQSSIHNKKIHFFTERLGHVWSKDIIHNFSIGEEDWRVLSTDRYIYHITTPHIPGKTLESFITQFNRFGEKKETKVELNDVDRTCFADENSLFVLKTGKKEEFYNLTALDHKTLEQKEYILELPVLRNTGSQFENNRWMFFGYYNGILFFYNKLVDNTSTTQKVDYEIAAISKESDLISKFTIKAALKNKAILPVNNSHSGQTIPAKNYKKKLKSIYEPILASYSNIYMDNKSGSIYIYGQYGPDICSSGKCLYEGVFLQKYSSDGDEFWRVNQLFPEKYSKRDQNLINSQAELFNSRLCEIKNDQHNEFLQIISIVGDSKNKRAYLTKFNYNGDYYITTRGSAKRRTYYKEFTLIEDQHNQDRHYEYDSFYDPGLQENTKGEDRFQELVNLTPGLDIAEYEHYSFASGEVIVEKLNQRKAIVFYYVKRD